MTFLIIPWKLCVCELGKMGNYVDRVRAWTLSIYFKSCRSRVLSVVMRTTRQSVKVRLSFLYHYSVMRESFEGKLWTFDELLLQFSNVQSWKKVIGLHKYSSKNETAFYGDFVQFCWWCYTASQHEKAVYRAREREPTDRMRMRNWNLPAHFDLWNFMVRCSRFCWLLLFCPIHSANVCSPKISSKFAAHRCFNNFFIALFLFPFSVVFRIFLLVFRWCFFFAARRNVMRAKFGCWLEILTVRTLIFAWHIVWCFSQSVRNERKSDAAKTKIGRLVRFFFAFTVLSSKKRRIVIFVNST